MGDFPCNQFASTYFNGGGHKNASGGEFYGSLSEAVAVFEIGLQVFNPNKSEDLGKLVAREIAHRAKRYLYIIAVLTNKDTKAYVLYA